MGEEIEIIYKDGDYWVMYQGDVVAIAHKVNITIPIGTMDLEDLIG